MSTVSIITDKDFDQQVINQSGTVIVNFTATWSPPSEAMSQSLRALAKERGDLNIKKMDIGGSSPDIADSDNPLTQSRINIRIFPTLLLFKNGEVAGMMVGETGTDKIAEWADSIIKNENSPTSPLPAFKKFLVKYYEEFEKASAEQAQNNFARAVKLHRRVSMGFAFSRAAAGLTLAALVPGPLTVILGGAVAGVNLMSIANTFRNKDKLPEEPIIKNGTLRTVFNVAGLATGTFLLGAAASNPFTLLATVPAVVFGLGLTWNAVSGIGRDLGALFTTNLEKYPVKPPEEQNSQNSPQP